MKNRVFVIFKGFAREKNDVIWMVLSLRSVLERLVLQKYAECTSRHVKRTSGARVMFFFLSLDRSIARSIARRSLDRSISRSLARSLARSLDRWLARLLARSLRCSLPRSLGLLTHYSRGSNLELWTCQEIIWGGRISNY